MNKEYDFAPISRKKEEAAAEAELKKSSYIISNGLQRKMKSSKIKILLEKFEFSTVSVNKHRSFTPMFIRVKT